MNLNSETAPKRRNSTAVDAAYRRRGELIAVIVVDSSGALYAR